jgi:hypothetical protein
MKLHYETSVRDGVKAAKPNARPTGAVFTYRPLKVKTSLKAGMKQCGCSPPDRF